MEVMDREGLLCSMTTKCVKYKLHKACFMLVLLQLFIRCLVLTAVLCVMCVNASLSSCTLYI